MLGGKSDGAAKGAPPGSSPLSRQTEDEIEVDVGEANRTGSVKGCLRFLSRVDAPQKVQLVILEALYAQAEAVDAQTPQVGEALPVYRARVGLAGDFGIVVHGEGLAANDQDITQEIRRQQRRRASA